MKQCVIQPRVSSSLCRRGARVRLVFASPILVGGVLVGGAFAAGCDTITEKVTQKVTESALEHALEKQHGGDVQIDTSKGSVSVKNEKGSIEINGAGGKVPETWPKDVPLYPGTKVTMSMSNDSQQVLYLETADSPDKAIEYYKAKLASLKQEAVMATEQQTMLAYKDDSGRQIQLSIGKDQGGSGTSTMIALIVNTPKKPAP